MPLSDDPAEAFISYDGSRPEAPAIDAVRETPGGESAQIEGLIELHEGSQLLAMSTSMQPSVRFVTASGQNCTMTSTAHIGGTFFGPAARTEGQIPSLTCYRRNLFQVSGTLICSKSLFGIISHSETTTKTVNRLHASLTATETRNNNPIKLLIVPPKQKTPPEHAGPVTQPDPLAIDIDIRNETTEQQDELLTYNLAWRRLQFRVATEKRGRKTAKTAIQHFVLHFTVSARLADGSMMLLRRQSSLPITVRGRSPINFATPKTTAALHSHSLIQGVGYGEPPPVSVVQDVNATASTAMTEADHSLECTTLLDNNLHTTCSAVKEPHLNQDFSACDDISGFWSQSGLDLSPSDIDLLISSLTSNSQDNGAGGAGNTLSYSWNSPLPTDLILPSQRREQEGHTSGDTAGENLDILGSRPSEPTPWLSPNMKETVSISLPTLTSQGTSSTSSQYEYLPLDLVDRTPPVRGVYNLHQTADTNHPRSSNHTIPTSESG
ncbi:hypothetical protein F5884DRAFT_26987 [Xylogone sp. PMI_703]|nr:hypothetical protein F5884DRAFT_26987 [Xylogone sp. PMI_703]